MKRIFALLLALVILLSACAVPSQPLEDLAPLEVRFLDVGQADAALVRCGEATMLVDGGNREDSSLIVSVLGDLDIGTLDYLVCTHAHEDHVGGLAGAINTVFVDTVLTPVTEYGSSVFTKFIKAANDRGCDVVVPKSGDTFPLGDATVTVLGPVSDYDDPNDTSIVLKLELGEVSFLFTGDMERDAEADLLDEWGEEMLSATVLKVGHHGSDTSTSYPFLRAVDPEFAVISSGKGNDYGHPHDEVLSRLRDASVTVYRTDKSGDIIAATDGVTVELSTDKTAAPSSPPAKAASYIGNKKSKVVHAPSCASLPAEQNREYFETSEEALDAGFTPCKNCMQ